MSNPLVLGIAVANAPPGVDADGVLAFVAESDEIETYQLAPLSPGVNRKAAFDAMLVLNAAGSVASIAGLLWMAYDKLVAPKKSDPNDEGGI